MKLLTKEIENKLEKSPIYSKRGGTHRPERKEFDYEKN